MKRLFHILLISLAFAFVAPALSVVDSRIAAVYAVDAKAKAKAQREKEKAKAAKHSKLKQPLNRLLNRLLPSPRPRPLLP